MDEEINNLSTFRMTTEDYYYDKDYNFLFLLLDNINSIHSISINGELANYEITIKNKFSIIYFFDFKLLSGDDVEIQYVNKEHDLNLTGCIIC